MIESVPTPVLSMATGLALGITFTVATEVVYRTDRAVLKTDDFDRIEAAGNVLLFAFILLLLYLLGESFLEMFGIIETSGSVIPGDECYEI